MLFANPSIARKLVQYWCEENDREHRTSAKGRVYINLLSKTDQCQRKVDINGKNMHAALVSLAGLWPLPVRHNQHNSSLISMKFPCLVRQAWALVSTDLLPRHPIMFHEVVRKVLHGFHETHSTSLSRSRTASSHRDVPLNAGKIQIPLSDHHTSAKLGENWNKCLRQDWTYRGGGVLVLAWLSPQGFLSRTFFTHSVICFD